MMVKTNQQAAARMRAISSLYGLGLSIQREKIRQANPVLDDNGVEHQLRDWLDRTGHTDPSGPELIRKPPRQLGCGLG